MRTICPYFNAVYSIQVQMGNSASTASAALPTKMASLVIPMMPLKGWAGISN